MFNTVKHLERLYQYFSSQGLTKLTEPADTGEYIYIAQVIDPKYDFETDYWLPVMSGLASIVEEHESGEYYTLNVFVDGGGVFYVTSSRGIADGIHGPLKKDSNTKDVE